MNAPAPRAGSPIDKAIKTLTFLKRPISRERMAIEIEYDEDEVDGLLRFGVRQGLLARSDAGEYSLGDGTPLGPVPAPPPPPAAPPRLPPAAPPPPMEKPAPQPVRAAPPPASPAPAVVVVPKESIASRAVNHLAKVAPHGGPRWLSNRELGAATDAYPAVIQACLVAAIKHRRVVKRLAADNTIQWQAGPGTAAAVPAPAPPPKLSDLRGMVKLPPGQTSESIVEASRAAWSGAPVESPPVPAPAASPEPAPPAAPPDAPPPREPAPLIATVPWLGQLSDGGPN